MKTEPTESLKNLIREVFDAYDFDGHDIENIVDYESAKKAVRSAFEEGQSNPKIKQLEWRYDEEFFIWEANSVFGKYFVKAGKNEGALTVDANKAAAQADFEKKIKECLE